MNESQSKTKEREDQENFYGFICKTCCFTGVIKGDQFRCSNCKSTSIIAKDPIPKDFIQDRSEFLEDYRSGLWSKLPPKKSVPGNIKVNISYYDPFYHIRAPGAHMIVVEKDKKKGLQRLKKAVKKAYSHIKQFKIDDFTMPEKKRLVIKTMKRLKDTPNLCPQCKKKNSVIQVEYSGRVIEYEDPKICKREKKEVLAVTSCVEYDEKYCKKCGVIF